MGTGGASTPGTGGSGGRGGTSGGPVCGNGAKEAPEQCDLGAANNTGTYGGCNANCTLAPYCGDGIVTSPEACDKGASGNTGAYGGCNANCTLAPYCGDGIVTSPEACDKGTVGNTGAYGGCTANCTLAPYCGDGIVTSPEACDKGTAGNTGAYGGCNANCTLAPYCGDGIVSGSEACDKGTAGNTGAYGGCTANCTLGAYCGDGTINGPEVCDNGSSNALQLGACNPECSGIIGVKSLRPAPTTPATFGGVAGADVMCHNAFGPTYKAVIVDGTSRVATTAGLTGQGQKDWALRKYTLYRNGNNQDVFLTDGSALLGVRNQASVGITNSIYGYSGEQLYLLAAWSATDHDWNYYAGYDCDSYSNTSGTKASGFISLSDTGALTFPNGGGAMLCDSQAHILCAEQ
jgi:cysteine-rich repeat protein